MLAVLFMCERTDDARCPTVGFIANFSGNRARVSLVPGSGC